MPGGIERGVGPVQRDVVRQGHVPGAERVVGPEGAQRILDGVPALHAEERPQPPPFPSALDVIRRQREREPVRVPGDHPAGDVELLQLHPRVAAVLHLAIDIDRPELRADLALSQALEIGVLRRAGSQVVGGHIARVAGGASDLPRQVVVSVDQRRGPEERAGARERGVGGRRLRVGGSGHQDESREEEEERQRRRSSDHRARLTRSRAGPAAPAPDG